jgi:hypothetical protein
MSDTAYNPVADAPEESMDSEGYLSNQQTSGGGTQVVRDRDADAGMGAVKRSAADSDRQLGMDYFYLHSPHSPSLRFALLLPYPPYSPGTAGRDRKLT